MTLDELKDLLSTYGANPEERSMQVFAIVNGVRTPIMGGEIEYGTWDEDAREWVDLDRGSVLLQAEKVVTA